MVGEFDKPRYFQYRADICAHGASGLVGCTRCLDVCPTDAIRSVGERVEVDPHLCQGAGGCATACPTGAITYAYPPGADALEGLRRLLGGFLGAGGSAPVVLIHDAESGRAWLETAARELPEHVLPWEVEEVGSLGLEAWLACLAWGAARVLVLVEEDVPGAIASELSAQVGWADAFLAGLGHETGRVVLVAPEAGPVGETARALRGLADAEPATFAPMGDKRTTLRQAVDHLEVRGRAPESGVLALPVGAPFGQVHVDVDACTLCMSCASVCPASALLAGGDVPRLDLVEQNCVQCGLCETACPERCVTRETRYLPGPGGALGAPGPQRGPALPLRVLRQALRHRADDPCHPVQAVEPLDVRREARGGAASGDVRRVPGQGHVHPGRRPGGDQRRLGRCPTMTRERASWDFLSHCNGGGFGGWPTGVPVFPPGARIRCPAGWPGSCNAIA